MNAVILSVDQWFNAFTVLRSGHFRIFGRTGLLFGPNQSSLFLSTQQLLDFQYVFSFSGANHGASLLGQFFQIVIWENLPLEHDRSLDISLLRAAVLAEISTRWFPLASR